MQVLLMVILLSMASNTVQRGTAHGSTSFSLADELAHGTSSIIVVPGNHSVAGEFDDYQYAPLQLTR
jgi:hypothetical protein